MTLKRTTYSSHNWRYPLVSVAVIALLAGCSTLTSPKEQPVIEDKIGENFGTLAVTAERRIIIFGRDKSDKDNIKKICAEPSPDVAESLVSSLKAIAEATAKNADIGVNLEISKTLATAISMVFTRSQGIQFFRDNMYALCQANLNGSIDPSLFATEFKRISELSAELIKQEIPSVDTKRAEAAAARAEQSRDAANQSAMAAKTSQTEANKSADAASVSAAEAKKK